MWWRKTGGKSQRRGTGTDILARMIANRIIVLQHAIVRRLQQWEGRFNRQQKKILLIIFCVISGSYCCYLLGNALFAKAGTGFMRGIPTQPVAQPPPHPLFKNKKDTINHQLFQNKKK